MSRAWFGAALVAILAYTVARGADLDGVAWVLKPVPVAILAGGVLTRSGAPLLGAALAVDALADGVIEASFLAGLALFLVGHVLRIAAFTRAAPQLAIVRAPPFVLVAVGVIGVLAPALAADRVLGAAVVAYAVAISAMAWRAAARVDGSTAGWLALAGAVLFVASDTLLAMNRFVTPLPAASLWILSTYWGAQICLAASAPPRG